MPIKRGLTGRDIAFIKKYKETGNAARAFRATRSRANPKYARQYGYAKLKVLEPWMRDWDLDSYERKQMWDGLRKVALKNLERKARDEKTPDYIRIQALRFFSKYSGLEEDRKPKSTEPKIVVTTVPWNQK